MFLSLFISAVNYPLITLKIHHGGEFRDMHRLEYVGGKIDIRRGC